MSEVTEKIKERINAADLIGEYLKLERAGSNFKALCPFHNEKTPSFMVNPERNFWYCFGCQKGGDIFSFVQEMEGIDFRDALEKLAEKAGIEIPRFEKFQNKEEKSQKKKVYEILEIATRYYQRQLTESDQGKKIIEYLKERRITGEAAGDFRIGYSPDGWENILSLLLKKGYKLDDINASGLLVERDEKNRHYDRFRNRIMFPIIDANGRVIGFSARALPGEDKEGAKYINTPQTIVYDKSKVLYGIYQARAEIRKKNSVILVEGNMDVVASFSAGVENIVAISGTALTQEQVDILKRYGENFKFCFDSDQAGRQAMQKSIKLALKTEIDVEAIILPKGHKDVNDLVIENSKKWEEVVSKSRPVMEYFFTVAFENYSPSRSQDRKNIAKNLLNIIKDIADPIEKNFWLKKLSEKLEIDEEVLTQVLERARIKERKQNRLTENFQEKNKIKEKKTRVAALQERLLGVLSLYLDELSDYIEKFKLDIIDSKYQKYWKKILNNDTEEVQSEINRFELSVKYAYDPNEGFYENDVDPRKEWDLVLAELEKEKRRDLLNKIAFDLKRAEEEGDKEAVNILTKEFSNLCKEEKQREEE